MFHQMNLVQVEEETTQGDDSGPMCEEQIEQRTLSSFSTEEVLSSNQSTTCVNLSRYSLVNRYSKL